jgi:hypothetical protein
VALAVLAIALAGAVPARAAEISVAVKPAAGVRLGDPLAVGGVATESGAPLAGRTVRLEVRAHPFTGRWRKRGTTVTAADGSYAFQPALGRNHEVRARLLGTEPAPDVLSPAAFAYVLPDFTLSFRQRSRRVLRLRQVYTVPRDVELTARTRFYVGPCEPDARDRCTARRARFRVAARTEQARPGHYVARATVRIPRSFHGRFQYLSCFRYSPGSGMGDPQQSCPRRTARLSG